MCLKRRQLSILHSSENEKRSKCPLIKDWSNTLWCLQKRKQCHYESNDINQNEMTFKVVSILLSKKAGSRAVYL